jgi:hypothetical protein
MIVFPDNTTEWTGRTTKEGPLVCQWQTKVCPGCGYSHVYYGRVTIDGFWNGRLDLLHLYTQLLITNNTALWLNSTLYRSPLHTHSNAQSSLIVSWQRTSTQKLYHSHYDCTTHEVVFGQPLNHSTATSVSSQSHITTDGQLFGLSWCRAPSGAHDQIFLLVRKLQSCP